MVLFLWPNKSLGIGAAPWRMGRGPAGLEADWIRRIRDPSIRIYLFLHKWFPGEIAFWGMQLCGFAPFDLGLPPFG